MAASNGRAARLTPDRCTQEMAAARVVGSGDQGGAAARQNPAGRRSHRPNGLPDPETPASVAGFLMPGPVQEIVTCDFFALGGVRRSGANFPSSDGGDAMKLNKLLVIAGAGALWMAAVAPSGAADIPAAPVVKAPVMVPAKQSWYGFYIGVHGGYGWSRNAITATPDAFYTPFFIASGLPNTFAGDAKGFIGGITYGSNYQFDRIVLGFDSDFSFTDIKASQTINGTVGGVPFTSNSSQKLDLVRHHAGARRLPALRQHPALRDRRLRQRPHRGLEQQHRDHRGRLLAPGCAARPAASRKNKWGWAAGGGIEVASGPWQFRAEYLHYDLGTRQLSRPRPGGAGCDDRRKPQGVRRHGARRHHLPLQLDAARPDLRHRPDLIFFQIRVVKEEQPAQRPAVSL